MDTSREPSSTSGGDDGPATRWSTSGSRGAYGPMFAGLISAGQDIDGEARLADAMLPRHARVLDAGAGMGRVGAALAARGHSVLAIEPDAELVAQARATYPELAIADRDILSLTEADGPFDLVVCVGNVMVFLAEGSERPALAAMRRVLAEEGRIMVGYHLQDPPGNARRYPAAEFEADAASVGLRVEHRFGSYELQRANPAYGVWVLGRA